ncbi:acyltransferase family protein [Salinimicrobium sp. TIG7-5_MAKvit]|uniref:acyltransferase family protein n=1 Tax=Salinimicrobium sp. TIG7-5_MAKvit TaxID=3121289 RepID=UPI003C6DD8A5
MKTQRRYDIDWLRVIAIGLLLIYHIAIVFQPWAMFIGFIRSEELMESLWKPMSMLNIWRIPLLFYVSGMGVYFAVQKRNWKELLLERSKRILLPYIFGVIAIVPLHFLIFQKYYHLPLGYYAHQGHLWFLANIFVYILIFFPLFFYLKKIRDSRFVRKISSWMRYPAGPLSATIFFALEVLLVKPQVFEMYAETWHGFFLGMIAFFFGFFFIFIGETFWQTVFKWKWLYLGLALTLCLVRFTLFNLVPPAYLLALESNCWIFAIFGLGFKYLNKPGHTLTYLSQAAYPVYIIHMFVLYAASMIILPFDLPVFLKFVTIVAFTGIGCFVIYEFGIRRIYFLRPFFGLKWKSKAGRNLGIDKKIKKKEILEIPVRNS